MTILRHSLELLESTRKPLLVPTSCRIAVKEINHLGDEAMKEFRLE